MSVATYETFNTSLYFEPVKAGVQVKIYVPLSPLVNIGFVVESGQQVGVLTDTDDKS